MRNLIKLFSLVFVLSLTTVACSNDKKACEADCKKECCEKKDDAKACEPGCEKECCKAKADDIAPTDSASVDGDTTEVTGEEQAHACTAACESDPHSCPNHKH